MSLALIVCALINGGLLSTILHFILVYVKHAEPLKSALLNSNPHTTWGPPPTIFLFALPFFCIVQCYLLCVFVQVLCSAVTGRIENSILFTFFHFYFMWVTGKLKTNYLTVQNRHLSL